MCELVIISIPVRACSTNCLQPHFALHGLVMASSKIIQRFSQKLQRDCELTRKCGKWPSFIQIVIHPLTQKRVTICNVQSNTLMYSMTGQPGTGCTCSCSGRH